MVSIENLADPAALRARVETFGEPELLGQQLSHQGAIHVLTFLLANGCTEALAIELLRQLRQHMETVVQVAEAKGFKRLFSDVPPNFN